MADPTSTPASVPHIATPDFWTQMQLLLVGGGFRLVIAIIILVTGWALASWVKRWVETALQHLPLDTTLKPLIASLLRYTILILTLVLVLGQFGVQTTSLIAVMGATGLAVGLAMQGTLSNVAAGVMLLILRPFRVDHYISAGGQEGTVREIGLFTTILTTNDNVYVSIPNSLVFSGVTINYTRERTRRVKFNLPVDRANDLELVEKIIVASLTANSFILKEPAPSAVVAEVQEYSVVMTARATARSTDYWTALYAAQKDVQTALDRVGILYPVTRQAAAVRNEPRSPLTAPPDASEENAPPDSKDTKDTAPRDTAPRLAAH